MEEKLKKLFPTFAREKFASVNLDSEARLWAAENPALFPNDGQNPLRLTENNSLLVDWVHKKHGVRASFGGYLEDRSFLWKDTYLSSTGSFIHAGVDINIPAGTPIRLPFDGVILRTDDDTPAAWGWGPRVFVMPRSEERHSPNEALVLIIAHLGAVRVRSGEIVKEGLHFADVGTPPGNGGWFPHIHLQAIRRDYFDELSQSGFESLDGYFHEKDIDRFKALHPDPWSLIK